MKRLGLVVAFLAVATVAGYAYVRHAQPDWYLRLRYPLAYESGIRGYAHQDHLDPALVAAVVYEESRFRPDTRSSAGAVGLMQLLPSTAKGIAIRTGGGHFHPLTDLLNPDLNLRYGCWYLRHLELRYHRMDLALAAYNAGEANVDQWLAETPKGKTPVIQFATTRTYVSDVQHAQAVYRRIYASQLGYTGHN